MNAKLSKGIQVVVGDGLEGEEQNDFSDNP